MASSKVFVMIEAADSPAGAVLVRYQIVERVEPDPEEARLAASEADDALKTFTKDMREEFKAQFAAAQSMIGGHRKQITYRTDEKVVVCTKPEEISAAIAEAKEAYDEIRKLTKAGARFDFVAPKLHPF